MIAIIPLSSLGADLRLSDVVLSVLSRAAHGRFRHVEANADVVVVSHHVGGGRHVYLLLKFRPFWPEGNSRFFEPGGLPMLLSEDAWQYCLLIHAAHGDWMAAGCPEDFLVVPTLVEAVRGYGVSPVWPDGIELRLQALALGTSPDVQRHVEVGACGTVPILEVVLKQRIQGNDTEAGAVRSADERVEGRGSAAEGVGFVEGHGGSSEPIVGDGSNPESPPHPKGRAA